MRAIRTEIKLLVEPRGWRHIRIRRSSSYPGRCPAFLQKISHVNEPHERFHELLWCFSAQNIPRHMKDETSRLLLCLKVMSLSFCGEKTAIKSHLLIPRWVIVIGSSRLDFSKTSAGEMNDGARQGPCASDMSKFEMAHQNPRPRYLAVSVTGVVSNCLR